MLDNRKDSYDPVRQTVVIKLKKKYRTHREQPHWIGKAGYGGRKAG